MPAPELDLRPVRILLVEDNPDDALLLERNLRRNGFAPELNRIETPEEMAAALASGAGFDLVLADYNLPRFSGPAALLLLQESELDIPFIMLSGVISEATAVESMRAGAQDYVAKQNLARLVPAVERELKEAAARRKSAAAELALIAAEDRFRRLVTAMPLGLLIVDTSGHITYANGAAERLLGLTDENRETCTLASLCPALGSYRQILNAPVPPEPFESHCVTAAGQAVDVLLGMAVLNPDAEPEQRQLAAFLADLRLQKKSEEMLRRTEKLAVAGRLAASIAHEINNPLEAVTNLLYLIGHTELADDARGYLSMAQTELNRVAQITVQTLRFHRRSTRPGPVEMPELLGSVLALYDSRLRHLSAEVRTRYRTVPKVIVHDGEIRQVMANLVGNAIDALPFAGRLELRVAPGVHPVHGGRGVMVTVADNGSGMSPEVRARIFEPFFSTKGQTGTGLGLWVSQEIIEKHRGALRVTSRRASPGRSPGTVFRLFLPLSVEEDSAARASDARERGRLAAAGDGARAGEERSASLS